MNEIVQMGFVYGNHPMWKANNAKKGLRASVGIVSSGVVGIASNYFNNDSYLSWFLRVVQTCLQAFRNHEQYNLYLQPSDDIEMDCVKKPLVGKVGKLACFIETNINPILKPLASLISEQMLNKVNLLANFCTLVWWRLRLATEPVQLQALKALPSALKKICSGDITQIDLACIRIDRTIAPWLGSLGLMFITIGSLSQNNILRTLGNSTQHCAYLFKFTLPSLCRAITLQSKANLILFLLGIGANICNLLSPIMEYYSTKKSRKISVFQNLATTLSGSFFSLRRRFIGTGAI